MKKIIFVFLLLFLSLWLKAQNFSNYFANNASLCMYYSICYNRGVSSVYLNHYQKINHYAGRKNNLTSYPEYGIFKLEIFDKKTGNLIYNYFYKNLFSERITVDEYSKGAFSMNDAIVMPWPKNDAIIQISMRDSLNNFYSLYKEDFSPNDISIIKDKPVYPEVQNIMINQQDNSKAVDIVIVPEGYSAINKFKFLDDAKQFVDVLFRQEPFKSNQKYFNVRAVLAFSKDDDVDYPSKGIFRNTLMNFHYDTFGMDRYLTSDDCWSIMDVVLACPFDNIVVLANSSEYGGCGIFNSYAVFPAHNSYTKTVLVHEFGHAFAGLGDEYEDGIPDGYGENSLISVEPIEPNVTTLANFESKWADLVDKKTPIPTPNYSLYAEKVGAFEGCNYHPKGYYRPQRDCIMRSNQSKSFCKVCYRAIEKMIEINR